MLAEEDKRHKITEIGWWYAGLRKHITFWYLQAFSRLQFTRLLEEAKCHYKYFGDNQTDKQSVMTHFELCGISQESQTQNSKLGDFSTFCSYYSQGSKKINYFPNKLCSTSFCFISIISKSLKETVLDRHPLRGHGGALFAEFYLFQKSNCGCFLSFNTAKYIGCPQGIPGNEIKHPNIVTGDQHYIHYAMDIYMKHKLSQSLWRQYLSLAIAAFHTSKHPCSLHSWSQTCLVSKSCHWNMNSLFYCL